MSCWQQPHFPIPADRCRIFIEYEYAKDNICFPLPHFCGCLSGWHHLAFGSAAGGLIRIGITGSLEVYRIHNSISCQNYFDGTPVAFY